MSVIRYLNDPQLNTYCTLELLQGHLLLALYEFGHAIYPSAFTRIGICTRHATLLGLGFDHADDDSTNQYSWSDAEERRRTWWAIYLMER